MNGLNIISLAQIKKSFAEKTVLKHIDMEIKHGDRIGLIGYNGTGKTTLANILTGNLAPDGGTIQMAKEQLSIGYLRQSIEYTASSFKKMMESHAEEGLFELTSQLGLSKTQRWENEQLNHLSGGEKLKLALAHIWAEKPDILILDEPTNHLDLEGIEWLTNELKVYKGAAIIISHDRYFLDKTVKRMYELEQGELRLYEGNYTSFKQQKDEWRRTRQQQYENQQREIKRINRQIAQLQNWSDKAHRESTKQEAYKEYYRMKAKKMDIQVKSKQKRLEAELEKRKIDKPLEELKVEFDFKGNDKRGKRIIEAKKITKKFENKIIFEDSQFYIKHGEKFALIGPNGSGKTTLIKMILEQETWQGGELWKSPSLRIGYLSQDVGDLPSHLKPLEALKVYNRDRIGKAMTIFANLGFSADQLDGPISSLSLGQRTKVKLVGLLLDGYDLLILDEPTNHLDLPSREQLEETLTSFNGTLLIVSHDQYFLEKLCNRWLVIDHTKIRRIEGNPRKIQQKKSTQSTNLEDELLVLDTKITAVLSDLSLQIPGSEVYEKLDKEFKQLMEHKKQLKGRKEDAGED